MGEIEREGARLDRLGLAGAGVGGDEAGSEDHNEEGDGNDQIMHCVVLLVEASAALLTLLESRDSGMLTIPHLPVSADKGGTGD